MAILPIRLWPDPVLTRTCAPVTDFDAALARLAEDMLETMYAAPGRGLAAPQVGVLRRLFVMDVAWKEGPPAPFVCVNPEILGASETSETGEEGCLSIPGVPMPVTRPAGIALAWSTPGGARRTAELTGAAARCAQHELDHLDGRTIFARTDPALRDDFAARYADRPA